MRGGASMRYTRWRDPYAQKPKRVDHTKCPRRGSRDITADDVEATASEARSVVTCLDCGAEWTDVYELTGYEKLTNPHG